MMLTCCCCGGGAPAQKQWFNRDRGYGLCGGCADYIKGRPDYNVDEFRSCYGDEGVHWFKADDPRCAIAGPEL
jgi:hypothetical protein